jgi:hypothetical protein
VLPLPCLPPAAAPAPAAAAPSDEEKVNDAGKKKENPEADGNNCLALAHAALVNFKAMLDRANLKITRQVETANQRFKR